MEPLESDRKLSCGSQSLPLTVRTGKEPTVVLAVLSETLGYLPAGEGPLSLDAFRQPRSSQAPAISFHRPWSLLSIFSSQQPTFPSQIIFPVRPSPPSLDLPFHPSPLQIINPQTSHTSTHPRTHATLSAHYLSLSVCWSARTDRPPGSCPGLVLLTAGLWQGDRVTSTPHF